MRTEDQITEQAIKAASGGSEDAAAIIRRFLDEQKEAARQAADADAALTARIDAVLTAALDWQAPGTLPPPPAAWQGLTLTTGTLPMLSAAVRKAIPPAAVLTEEDYAAAIDLVTRKPRQQMDIAARLIVTETETSGQAGQPPTITRHWHLSRHTLAGRSGGKARGIKRGIIIPGPRGISLDSPDHLDGIPQGWTLPGEEWTGQRFGGAGEPTSVADLIRKQAEAGHFPASRLAVLDYPPDQTPNDDGSPHGSWSAPRELRRYGLAVSISAANAPGVLPSTTEDGQPDEDGADPETSG